MGCQTVSVPLVTDSLVTCLKREQVKNLHLMGRVKGNIEQRIMKMPYEISVRNLQFIVKGKAAGVPSPEAGEKSLLSCKAHQQHQTLNMSMVHQLLSQSKSLKLACSLRTRVQIRSMTKTLSFEIII